MAEPVTSLRPYYEADGITIYHGDSLAVLPRIKGCGLVVTDPPYGIGMDSVGFKNNGQHGWRNYGYAEWDTSRPTIVLMNAVRNAAPVSVIWGGNYFADMLPPTMGWLVWDKGQRSFSLADAELAWTSEKRAVRIIDCPRGSVTEARGHPTQKPIYVMKYCIEWSRTDGTVLDPFMGSGSTLVAAKQLGRKAIGIEIEEKYCEIAAERLGQRELFGIDG